MKHAGNRKIKSRMWKRRVQALGLTGAASVAGISIAIVAIRVSAAAMGTHEVPAAKTQAAHGTLGAPGTPGGITQGGTSTTAQIIKSGPLEVLGTSPANQASNVSPAATIEVDLSSPLANSSPMPTLAPLIAGSWSQIAPGKLQFQPTESLVPGSSETLTIPPGPQGVIGTYGQELTNSYTTSFNVADGSALRLQELLAELGYLPLSFTPIGGPVNPQDLALPQLGSFNWKWPNLPVSLTSLWTQGSYNEITKGAVMSFESQHGLAVDGIAGPLVWSALLSAINSGAGDTAPYGYVYVSKALPETATIYQNGNAVFSTPVNTGVPGAVTPDGTFTVYERFVSTTMSGTDPNGVKYVDPGIPWVSYFYQGDALHGYVRAQYGFPQSNGCVEMPPANAKIVWPMTPIGTLVTVAN